MHELVAAAERLLSTIEGVHCGAEVQPGKVIRTSDVIAVCKAVQAMRWPEFIYTNSGNRVLLCDCGRLYDEGAVDADAYFICECGKLGQRMDEAQLTALAREEA